MARSLVAGLAVVLAGSALVGAGPTPPAGAVAPVVNGRIAFTSERSGIAEIYLMNADGSGQVRITPEDGRSDGHPSWSPDGSQIAFHSWRDGNAEIYVMNADGTGARRLTNDAGFDMDPAWSPDGRHIAYEHLDVGGVTQVHVIEVDGSDDHAITTGPSAHYFPQWSPDGSRIVLTKATDSRLGWDEDIVVIDADGSGERVLAPSPESDRDPSWSPDGRWIAYHRQGDDLDWEINIVAAEGGEPRQVTTVPGVDAWPRWSPDGTSLVFGSTRADSVGGDYDIYTMKPDGTGVTRLTDSAEWDIEPAWQPVAPPPRSVTCPAFTLRGKGRVGRRLRVRTAAPLVPGLRVGHVWQRDRKVLDRPAGAASYRIRRTDRGTTIRVRVTCNGGGALVVITLKRRVRR